MNYYEIIIGDSTINQSIREEKVNSPKTPWGVIDIIDSVLDATGIEIDTDDVELMKKLLLYFNN